MLQQTDTHNTHIHGHKHISLLCPLHKYSSKSNFINYSIVANHKSGREREREERGKTPHRTTGPVRVNGPHWTSVFHKLLQTELRMTLKLVAFNFFDFFHLGFPPVNLSKLLIMRTCVYFLY